MKTVAKAAKPKKTIKGFCQQILETKPIWYKEGEDVLFSDIEKAYKSYFGNKKGLAQIISRDLKGIIYSDGTRINNVTRKRLFTFEELAENIENLE